MAERGLDDVAGILRGALSELPEVVLAYLFGSRAIGAARPESDIDVAVLVTNESASDERAELARLFAHLGRVVPSRRLDVVLLNRTPSLLRHRVVSRGKLLFARDPRARIRFVTRTVREYQDMQVRRELFYRKRVERIRGSEDHGRSGDLLAQARSAQRLFE